MPKTLFDWQKPKPAVPDEMGKVNSFITDYHAAVLTISDTIKDRVAAKLPRDEAIEETLATFRRDVIRQINLKPEKD